MRFSLKAVHNTILAGAIAVFALAGLSGPASSEEMSAKQKEQIEKLIHDYIMNNPEIIIEAAMKHRAQQEAEAQQRVQQSIGSAVELFKKDDYYPRAGNREGDVQFVEFFDYQCGYCKQVFPLVMDLLEEDKNLDVVMVEYPVLGPVSEYAARAALASKKQGKYMEYHVALMGQRGRLSETKILQIAEEVDLDIEQLKRDMDTKEVADHINQNHQIAQALNIRGTPGFLIGEQIAPGAISKSDMVKMIKNVRNGS